MVYGDKDNFAGLIKDINKVLKRGILRGDEKYYFSTCFIANCFAHSVLNFQNKDLIELDSNFKEELYSLVWRFDRLRESKHQIVPSILCKKAEKDFIEKVKLCGLNIEKCRENDKLKKGQFKVAFYFDLRPGEEDLHFMRQENDGSWSSKAGASLDIEKFKTLPWRYKNCFKLIKVFKITNPYIVAENDRLNEEKE